jgi:purine-cytosine permease-like protein
MPRWLLPWLVPVGLVAVVVVIATSARVGAVAAVVVGAALALVAGLVGMPIMYKTYQANRPSQGGRAAKPPRKDPPNNRSLLR